MNKLLTKIATSFVGIAMAIGVGVAVGSNSKEASRVEAASAQWELVTSAPSDWSGEYILGNGTSGTIKIMDGSSFSSSSCAGVDATVTSSKITADTADALTIAKSSTSGKYTVKLNGMYIGKNANSNGIDANATWSTNLDNDITYSSGKVVIKGNGGRVLTWFASNSNFRYYASSNNNSQLYKKVVAQTFTVNFAVNTAGYGTVSQSSITGVPSGTSISTSNNTVTINGTTVTATPATNTAQYTYAFTGWSNNTGTVTATRTITANFTRTTNTFTVDGSNITHGSLDNTSNIEYDGDLDLNIVPESGYTYPSSVSVTMGGNDISNDVEYENGYLYYSPVRGNIVITATCPAAGNVYSISTTVTNGTYSGDTTITDNGGVASVTIAPTGDYKLPASVSVSGADHTYNASTGVISLSNATGNVTISAAMIALTEYSITVDETSGSHTGASTIKESRTASLTFKPDSGYGQPASVTVTGATYTWTRGTGVLSLSNPTGNVSVTYVASENELTSITLGTQKTAYILGEVFSMPVVTAHYSVADDKVVTGSATESGYDPYSIGNQSITISYTEGGITKTASYTATVSAKQVTTDTTWTRVTSINDLTAGTYIIGYEATAGSGTIVPLRSDGANATTTANGYFYTGTTAGSSNSNTISIAKNMTSTGYEFTVEKISSDVINIKNAAGNYLGATSGGTTSNKGRLYTSGNSNETNFTVSYSSGKFSMTAAVSGSYKYLKYNSGSPRYAVYNSSANDTSFYKKGTESTGSASLIRIVCDPAIDPATGYKGGDKFVGDKVYTTDFVVKKQYDTATTLEAVTGFTINGGEEVELTNTSNTITVSYTEGGITKSAEVVVAATERAAELESVQLVEKGEVKKSGYIDFASATWNLDNIYVHYYWSDDEFDTEVTLASLVATDDASIYPIKPTVGATSFTVSYEYLEVKITNNTITLTEAVRSDYVTSMSWGNTTAAHFKHFSGEQLTEEIVNTWHVKATYAGSGEGERLYWGDYDLYIGSKQITSLPYTWLSEDDGQALSIHYGEDVDGNEFVKTNATAVGNICATINAIDHDETTTGLLDKTATWTKEQSVEIYDGGSNLTELCDNGVDIDANIHMQGDSTAGSTAIRFWNDGIRCYNGNKLTFTPKNGAVITKITFASTGISFDDGVTDNSSSPFTINDGYGDSAITLSFALSSTVKMGSDVIVEYQIEGSETTTVHYANDMNHFDAQKKVVEFAKFMNTTMNGENVCSGTFAGLESAWETVSDKYDELFGASTTLDATELAWAKNMLKYANAAWGSDAENACVEKAMKTYEFCIAKYGVDPFMFESDGTTPLRSIVVGPSINTLFSKNSSTVSVIVIVSLISIAAVGGYFFLRKRKED